LGGRLCGACEQAFTSPAHASAASGTQWRCSRCALPLPEHNSPCPDCADRDTAFDRTVIAFDYIPPADALVLQMKRGKRYAQADLLGNLLAEAVRHAQTPLSPDTVLIPTPSSSASLRERGFNPAAEIARALGRDLGLRIRHDLVWRNREQARQSSRHRLERLQAVQGLYACSPSVAKMRIGLVDDVMTTGSTLHEIAFTLKRAGAASVTALVAARTPHMPEKSIKTTGATGFFRK
jgi:ComF family protein